MKSHALVLFALLFASLTPASAQITTSPGDASTRIYNWCMARPDGTIGECACVAGFYAGATEDDTFRIVARLVEYLSPDGSVTDPEAMGVALREEAAGQSISSERFAEIMASFATFDQVGVKADSVCLPLKSLAEPPADE